MEEQPDVTQCKKIIHDLKSKRQKYFLQVVIGSLVVKIRNFYIYSNTDGEYAFDFLYFMNGEEISRHVAETEMFVLHFLRQCKFKKYDIQFVLHGEY